MHHLTLPVQEEGRVQVYATPARYFCCTVIAQALQTSAHGKRTLIVQLLKGGIGQGIDSPSRLGEYFVWVRPDISRCLFKADFSDVERDAINSLWSHVKIHIQDYDVVILEEIGLALKWGLISEAEIIQFMQRQSPNTELILVGTEMPKSFYEWADQWTEVKPQQASVTAA